MKIAKKLTALLLTAVIALSGGMSTAAVSAAPSAAGNETTIIDVTNKPETSILDEFYAELPSSGVDLSDTEYAPTDLTGYIKWDGVSAMQSGNNYYITDSVKLKKTVTVPENSTLVLASGSSVILYKDKFLNIKGRVLVEKGAEITSSGKLYVNTDAALECYGSIKATLSSVTYIKSEFIIRHGGTATYSGAVNVYKDGMYLNYGNTNLTKSSKMLVTGDFQTPTGGKLTNKGYFGVTISGRASFSGMYYLYGQSMNSGVFIFEKSVRYFKSKAAVFAVSKSSRLIDYRYYKPSSMSTDSGTKGIDVSYAQGAIDWELVRFSGVNFAMIRASRGYISDAKPMAQDVMFEYNITEATRVGLNVGVYHYLYAESVAEAKKEAKFFLETIKPYKITYPVVLDVEEQSQADLGKDEITKICKAFLDEVKAAGYYPMIYANKAWLTNYLDMSQLSEYEVWLAQWNTVPTYLGDFGMWQYSAKGIVSGIDTYVDLNLSYKDYAKLIREGRYNNLE